MSWLLLFLAGLFEIGWAVCLKRSEGFTLVGPSVAAAVLMAISVWLLAISLKTLPVGTAYAIWTGIGAIGTALIGMFYLGEPRDTMRLICLSMIAAGIVGLKLFTKEA
jgi:quaternary ammonium compound-resistance protein SugE